MKRTVKAWAWLWNKPDPDMTPIFLGSIALIKSDVRLVWMPNGLAKIVPCTITYDDGKPKKRRKAKR